MAILCVVLAMFVTYPALLRSIPLKTHEVPSPVTCVWFAAAFWFAMQGPSLLEIFDSCELEKKYVPKSAVVSGLMAAALFGSNSRYCTTVCMICVLIVTNHVHLRQTLEDLLPADEATH
mmetsp:Transcript_25034/g.62897  ORF Transcript_25034/g.62897 Transcript_25034/m.62897 type:complete len:119 (-) Transcript_25034:69-425(-)